MAGDGTVRYARGRGYVGAGMSLSVRPLETTWERRMLEGDKGEAPRPPQKNCPRPTVPINNQSKETGTGKTGRCLLGFFGFGCFCSGVRVVTLNMNQRNGVTVRNSTCWGDSSARTVTTAALCLYAALVDRSGD